MTKSKFRPKETGKKGRKKKEKVHLVFDPDARKEFLNGFHKRKQQKKADFKLRMEKKLAVEKQKIRAEAKKAVKKVSPSHSVLPEVESLLADQIAKFSREDIFEVGSKTVTITSLDSIKPAVPDVNNDLDAGELECDDDGPTEDKVLLRSSTKSMLKKQTNRLLQNSKVYKAAQRLKTKKNKRHQRPGSIKDGKKSKDLKASKESETKFRGKPAKGKGRRGGR